MVQLRTSTQFSCAFIAWMWNTLERYLRKTCAKIHLVLNPEANFWHNRFKTKDFYIELDRTSPLYNSILAV